LFRVKELRPGPAWRSWLRHLCLPAIFHMLGRFKLLMELFLMDKGIADLVNFAKSAAQTEKYATPADRLVKGQPMQHNTLHYAVDDKFFAGEWGAEVGCWRVKYTEHEYFHILSGKSIIRDTQGNEVELNPGDKFCVPAGFEGEWEVLEPTRKIYVIYEEPSG